MGTQRKVQKKFSDADAAFKFAEQLSKSCSYVCLIQSIDNYGKANEEIVFYVENESPLIRVWERLKYQWEDGKRTKNNDL